MVRRKHHNKFKTIEEDYLEWLYDLINRGEKDYFNLIALLNSVVYIDTFGNDKNRSYEGNRLRDEYRICSPNKDCIDDIERLDWCQCTFLEMMIALAQRLEELTYNPYENYDTSTSRWFWEMVENLGFCTYDDVWFENHFGESEYYSTLVYVRQTLEKINMRTCDYSKKGCLFPLQKCNRKVSQMELWDQANEYLVEQYPIV